MSLSKSELLLEHAGWFWSYCRAVPGMHLLYCLAVPCLRSGLSLPKLLESQNELVQFDSGFIFQSLGSCHPLMFGLFSVHALHKKSELNQM